MSRNSHYFVGKDMRAKMARIHTDNMDKKYSSEISECIRSSIVYSGGNPNVFCRKEIKPIPNNSTKIDVIDSGSVEAIFKYKEDSDNMAVLNFASYMHPGGMFMKGSKAQEECLCHASFLYNVLSSPALADFYDWNSSHRNRGMYLDRAICSPSVRFFNYGEYSDNSDIPETVTCRVITCASPNWSVAMRYGNFTAEENSKALRSRIEFVLHIAANFYCKTIILGAFGCGVFAQDGYEVAKIFKDLLSTKYMDVFEHVVFAIPIGEHDTNYSKFKSIFNIGGEQ